MFGKQVLWQEELGSIAQFLKEEGHDVVVVVAGGKQQHAEQLCLRVGHRDATGEDVVKGLRAGELGADLGGHGTGACLLEQGGKDFILPRG